MAMELLNSIEDEFIRLIAYSIGKDGVLASFTIPEAVTFSEPEKESLNTTDCSANLDELY